MSKVIEMLKDEYNITNEIFYLKNIKRNYFLTTFVLDNSRHKYKHTLEQFQIINNELSPLSEIINKDIVVKLKYVDGVSSLILNKVLIPIKEQDMTEEDLKIPVHYEDPINGKLDYLDAVWRKNK